MVCPLFSYLRIRIKYLSVECGLDLWFAGSVPGRRLRCWPGFTRLYRDPRFVRAVYLPFRTRRVYFGQSVCAECKRLTLTLERCVCAENGALLRIGWEASCCDVVMVPMHSRRWTEAVLMLTNGPGTSEAWCNAGLLLARRLQRRTSIKSALFWRFVLYFISWDFYLLLSGSVDVSTCVAYLILFST